MQDRFGIGVVCTVGVGPERGGRASNEDNYLICHDGQIRYRNGAREELEHTEGPGLLVAVADGMGGHDQGDMASGAAVRVLTHLFRAGLPKDPSTALRVFLIQAHAKLYVRAMSRGPVNLGTTVTALWVLDGVAWWVHVGDSRLYLLRGEDLLQVTRDQTRGEFAERDGRPTPRDPDALCQGFLFGSRGLGDDRSIRIDPGLDTGRLPLLPGDRLLLCSDGVYGHLQPDQIRQTLQDEDDAAVAASTLVEQAMGAKSDDNLTALVVIVEEVERNEELAPLDVVHTLVPE